MKKQTVYDIVGDITNHLSKNGIVVKKETKKRVKKESKQHHECEQCKFNPSAGATNQ